MQILWCDDDDENEINLTNTIPAYFHPILLFNIQLYNVKCCRWRLTIDNTTKIRNGQWATTVMGRQSYKMKWFCKSIFEMKSMLCALCFVSRSWGRQTKHTESNKICIYFIIRYHIFDIEHLNLWRLLNTVPAENEHQKKQKQPSFRLSNSQIIITLLNEFNENKTRCNHIKMKIISFYYSFSFRLGH